jgi:hypothetical protein
VDDNIINGKLMLGTNNPVATVAGTNRIRGGITGDYQAPGASALAKKAAPNRSTDATKQRADDRKAKATKSATAAGQAF